MDGKPVRILVSDLWQSVGAANRAKVQPVAWYSSHRRLKGGKVDTYRSGYLWRVGVSLPRGARALTLPDDPAIRVCALTVTARPALDDATLASLMDVPIASAEVPEIPLWKPLNPAKTQPGLDLAVYGEGEMWKLVPGAAGDLHPVKSCVSTNIDLSEAV